MSDERTEEVPVHYRHFSLYHYDYVFAILGPIGGLWGFLKGNPVLAIGMLAAAVSGWVSVLARRRGHHTVSTKSVSQGALGIALPLLGRASDDMDTTFATLAGMTFLAGAVVVAVSAHRGMRTNDITRFEYAIGLVGLLFVVLALWRPFL